MLTSILNRLGSHSKQGLRNIGRKFGLDIRLNSINTRDELRFVYFLKLHKINTVLDVGANEGQFAAGLFKAGYTGKIISFEPLPQAHAKLVEHAAKHGDDWLVAPPIALSNKAGIAKFYVTEANTSSSLLEPLDSFIEVTPIAKVEEHIEVQTEQLDIVLKEFDIDKQNMFLKIDVQGSESDVLKGATDILKDLKGLLIELSFTNLYSNQSSALKVQEMIDGFDFDIWDIWRGYFNPETKRLNQIDALYFRKG